MMMTNLVLLQGLGMTFFNVDNVREKLIPQSYEAVLGLFVEQFAQTPNEARLFKTRARTMLPPDIYEEAMQQGVSSLRKLIVSQQDLGADERADSVILDLVPLKAALLSHLDEILDNTPLCDADEGGESGFRFCKSAELQAIDQGEFRTRLELILKNEIPDSQMVSSPEVFELSQLVRALTLLQANIPFLIAGMVLFYFLLLLLIHRQMAPALKWFGGVVVALGLLMLLFGLSLAQLPEVLPGADSFTYGEASLLRFFVSAPGPALRALTFALLSTGVVCFGGGILYRRRNESS